MKKMRKGFTLIELMISMVLMAVLISVYFLVANPAGQLAAARNSERFLQLQTIMGAIEQNVADQSNRQFSCSAGPVPVSSTRMGSASGSYNIASCLVPTYGLSFLPYDPSASSAHFTSLTDYDTGYTISINASGTLIKLVAPYSELGKSVSTTGW